jgi:glycosyltransferase involved in cell wall biosynthesis
MMPSQRLEISVIVAVRNAVATVEACLDSVLDQDHPNVQLVVIDGASTDGTREVIEGVSDRIGYRESAPDRGICHAWNKGIDHAIGEWVLFLGADDRLAGPDVLRKAASALEHVRPIRVAYGSVDVVRPDGSVDRVIGQPWDQMRDLFRQGMSIPHQGTFHHRSLFVEHGPFDERYRIIGDYDFLLRELLERDAWFIEDLLVCHMGSGGLSDDAQSPGLIRELHRAWYEHGLTRTPPGRTPAVIRAAVRDGLTRTLGRDAEARITRAYRRALRRPPAGTR